MAVISEDAPVNTGAIEWPSESEAQMVVRRIKDKRHCWAVAEGDRRTVGPFDLQFFAVNHSIPDALAVGIRTPAGSVLHTGDIKLDQLPLDGRLTDLSGFSKFGDEGVEAFGPRLSRGPAMTRSAATAAALPLAARTSARCRSRRHAAPFLSVALGPLVG